MSKNTEKKLCQYVNFLENLLILIMDNNEKKNCEAQKKLDKLKSILANKGITPEEIETAALNNGPYDLNLENLSEDLVNEYIPQDINNYMGINNQKDIIKYIEQQHLQLNSLGINLNEDQNQK